MASQDVELRLSLKNRREVAAGIHDVGSEVSRLGDQTEKAGRKADRSGRGFDRLTGAAGFLGKSVLRGAAAIGILGAATGAWAGKSALDIQDATMNLTTLTGSAKTAKAMVKELSDYGNSTTFDTAPLAQSAQQMLAFGIAQKDVVPDMKMLGDIAMGNQDKLNGLAYVFAQVQGAGKLMGQDLNQMINQGFNPLQYISKRTGQSMGELREAMSKGQISFDDVAQAMKDATAKGATFYQGASNGSKTVRGAWGNLTGTLSSGLGMALQPALPLVSKLLGRLSDLASDAIPHIANGVERLIKAGDSLGDLGFGRVSTGVKGAGGILQKVLPTLRDLLGSLLDAARQVGPVMVETFTKKVLPAVLALGRYLAKTLFPVFKEIGSLISDQLVPAFAAVAVFLYGKVYPAIIDIAAAVAKKLRPVFETLVQVFRTQVLPTIASFLSTFKTQILPALEPVIQKVIGLAGFLAKLAATILSVVLPPLLKLAGFIFKVVVPVAAKLIVFVLKLINGVLGFGRALGVAVGKVATFAGTLTSLVIGAVGKVADAIGGLPGKLIALGGKFLGAGKTLIGKFFTGLKSLAGKAGGVLADLGKTVLNGIVDILNVPITAINHAIPDKIALKGLPDINLPDNPIPTIPRFAKGGVVTKRPGGLLSVVGEGSYDEAIVPLNGRDYLVNNLGVTPLPAPVAEPLDLANLPEPPPTAPGPGAGGQTVVQVVLDRKVLAEALLDDFDDRAARR